MAMKDDAPTDDEDEPTVLLEDESTTPATANAQVDKMSWNKQKIGFRHRAKPVSY